MEFGKYIQELLREHDCVILPGLGGFVANYKPAEFDSTRNSVSPPSKHILFNRSLIHNDGLLYAHVSKNSGYGYKEVENMAQGYIENIRQDTLKGMKHSIEGLGYLFMDDEKNIQFAEEPGNNFLLESYGLPLLQYREFEKLPKPEAYRAITPDFNPEVRKRRIRNWAVGAAAACLVSAMVFIPIRTGMFEAGFDFSGIGKTRNELKQVNESSGPEQAVSNVPAVSAFFPDPEFHIIVGSFQDFGNARELRSQVVSKGYNARILCTEKGAYRVTAGTYKEQDEAGVELAFVLSDYDDAWVLSN